jgi:arginine deiminase
MSAHSESGQLKSVFIKRAKDAFIDDAHITKHWEALNYLGKPEINTALIEYEAFVQVFKDNGTEIDYLP